MNENLATRIRLTAKLLLIPDRRGKISLLQRNDTGDSPTPGRSSC